MDMPSDMPRVPFYVEDGRFLEDVRSRWMWCDGGCNDWFGWEKFAFYGCYLYKDLCPKPPKEWLEKKGNSKNLWQWQHWKDGRWDATWLCVNCLIIYHNKKHGIRYTPNQIKEYYGLRRQIANEFMRKRQRTAHHRLCQFLSTVQHEMFFPLRAQRKYKYLLVCIYEFVPLCCGSCRLTIVYE